MTAERLTICCSHADPTSEASIGAPGTGAAGMHEAWERARSILARFAPDLVVFFGTDHRRAFRSVIPTVAIALGASARGDRGGPVGDYVVPTELSRCLAEGLVAREIDAALAYGPALDHAFGLTARDLLGGIAAYPIVPIFVNTASPPVPTLARVATIGRAVGEVLAPRPERILFLASGGLTHDLPGFYPDDDGVDWTEPERLEHNARLNVELRVPGRSFTSEWDHELLAGLAGATTDWLGPTGAAVSERAGNGANEALTWVAAWAAGGEPLEMLGYAFDAERSTSTGMVVSASATRAN